MESIVGVKYQYSGTKIGHITVLTEPRTGLLLDKKGQPTTAKSCLVGCICGLKYELTLKNISNDYTTRCKNCGKTHGDIATKKRVKSLFVHWMGLWKPTTHKVDTYKLPYFKGSVGEEYIAGFCYIDKSTYRFCKKVMCIKPKHYVRYNLSKDNCKRLGILYEGCSASGTFVHRLVGNIPDDLLGDHISGITLDNRTANIRPATTKQNNHNNKVVTNKNKFKGIVYEENSRLPWRAQLMINKSYYAKMFSTLEEAINYRDCFTLYIQEDFAYLNHENKREYYKTIMYSVLEDRHLALKSV